MVFKLILCTYTYLHSSLYQLCPLCNFDPKISKTPTLVHITWEDVELQHWYPRAKCYTIRAKVRWRSKVPLQLGDKTGFLSSRLDVRRQTLSSCLLWQPSLTLVGRLTEGWFSKLKIMHMIQERKGAKEEKNTSLLICGWTLLGLIGWAQVCIWHCNAYGANNQV